MIDSIGAYTRITSFFLMALVAHDFIGVNWYGAIALSLTCHVLGSIVAYKTGLAK